MRETIGEVMKDADFNKVTMKTLIKDVFSKYPDQNLNDKKDWIKSVVKEVSLPHSLIY